MKIAIASGKGGTGKTTFSVNLAGLLKEKNSVLLLDLDVEEPNCRGYLDIAFHRNERVGIPVPEADPEKCIGCGACANACEFNALAALKSGVMVFHELCHGCGRCFYHCKQGAIREVDFPIGTFSMGGDVSLTLGQGLLDAGRVQTKALIGKVKETCRETGHSVQLWDCPPGTTCPMIEGIRGADKVVLVTEPTPFGLHDLKPAVEVVRELKIPFGLVINKASSRDELIEEYAFREKVPVWGKIPFSRQAAEISAEAKLLIHHPGYREKFEEIIGSVLGGEL